MTASSGAPAGTEPARHAIVIKLAEGHEDHPGEPHDYDCHERTVECPGVTPKCEMWGQCDKTPECSDRTWPTDDDWATFHGVEHQFFRHDSFWGVPDGVCFYATDWTCDAIEALGLNEPGRYEIDVETDDEVYPVFHLIHGAVTR